MPENKNRGESGIETNIIEQKESKRTLEEVLFAVAQEVPERVRRALVAYTGANKGITNGKLKYTPEQFLVQFNDIVPQSLRAEWKKVKKGIPSAQIVEKLQQAHAEISRSIQHNKKSSVKEQESIIESPQEAVEPPHPTAQEKTLEDNLKPITPLRPIPKEEFLAHVVVAESSKKSETKQTPAELEKTDELLALEAIIPQFEKNKTGFTYSEDIYKIAQQHRLPANDTSIRRLIKLLYGHYGKEADFKILENKVKETRNLREGQAMLRELCNLLEERKDPVAIKPSAVELPKKQEGETDKLNEAMDRLEKKGSRVTRVIAGLQKFLHDAKNWTKSAKTFSQSQNIGELNALLGHWDAKWKTLFGQLTQLSDEEKEILQSRLGGDKSSHMGELLNKYVDLYNEFESIVKRGAEDKPEIANGSVEPQVLPVQPKQEEVHTWEDAVDTKSLDTANDTETTMAEVATDVIELREQPKNITEIFDNSKAATAEKIENIESNEIFIAALEAYKNSALENFIARKLAKKPGTPREKLENIFEDLWETGEEDEAKRIIIEGLKEESLL